LRRRASLLLFLALLALARCSRSPSGPRAPRHDLPRFTDVTEAAGIDFTQRTGAAGMKYLIETMGAGVCAFDYDADGLTDLYLVQSAPLPGTPPDPLLHASLFKNLGRGRFVEVTGRAGVGNPGRYGMGCAVADIDNDGDEDLYVTNFGPNTLYRNNGDGTFADVSRSSHTDNSLWGTAAAFADYDADGDVDLFVGNYLDFTLAKHKRCGDVARQLVSYCHPDAYESVPNALYRNDGRGVFSDVTRAAGLWNLEGKTLGALWTDYDQDGDVDLFVANDSVRNFLYRNNGDGTFTEVTLAAGTGYSEEGRPQAGMGVDAADVAGHGRMDLFVTHLSNEVNELYINRGDGTFLNGTNAAGLGAPSLLLVGWGTAFFDADNDGDPDLYVTNGHVMDDIEQYSDSITYRERDLLFVNDGKGRFADGSVAAGPFFLERDVGRGMTVLDFDADGAVDIALNRNGSRAKLLRNETRAPHHWISLRLRGTRSNRDAIGAWITLRSGGRRLVAERRSGFSYLSDADGIIHFGLGTNPAPVEVEIRWPSGLKEAFRALTPDRFVTLTEGSGVQVTP
jgi:hypothetical protein